MTNWLLSATFGALMAASLMCRWYSIQYTKPTCSRWFSAFSGSVGIGLLAAILFDLVSEGVMYVRVIVSLMGVAA